MSEISVELKKLSDESEIRKVLARYKVRYCDRFERRDGTWRIAHRVVAYEPGRIDAVGLEPEMSDQHPRGVRDRSDPAYRR